jgi:uncharacterized protein (DUF305 family)
MIPLKSTLLTMATFAVTLTPFATRAEDMMKMDHSMMTQGGIYDDAMKTMHDGMSAVKPTGDADVDFVQGMIPHHQGAIDMANVVLKNGKDPEIKKLAEGIIKAQESEIKLMNDWLSAHKK